MVDQPITALIRQLNLLFRAAKNKRRAGGDWESNRTKVAELTIFLSHQN